MGANFNFNRVILGGRLTSDPELKTTPSGTYVTSFTVAVNRRGSKDGQQMTDFITCVAFRERAEFVTKYFRKGGSICIVGEIQTRKWQDGNGNNRYATEVIVNEVNFVETKSDNATSVATTNTVTAPTFEEISNDEDLPF